ncbi:5-methylcytosine-specific restriction endonuclease system specificity protein McrC [Staphylococcus sp. ACRSN]|uniref:5-methylcytosine-specific restriction endonuclease system specificity protein McrC n=1 Tax=Staphylococcus sp. ACRSN TaxID=2918214 RepID=UPI001EF3C81C|nr:5-methylcytosine-specific restriction endonuclease system specificity protein McrC [Staphylococcus sp. ACRSN]MCG7338851.1 5-methylcytosine-specific restriction endonuclease system specificity protein McrC [Staphylococcus sp. ACRSN]
MIEIKNIYYMLSYAFTILKENGYKEVLTEQFNNSTELYTEILVKGVSNQIKRGLHYEYVEQQESLTTLRGKIDISQSIRNQDFMNKKLSCTYDEFSKDNYMNQIIKTTMLSLLKNRITKKQKKNIKNLLAYFENIKILNIRTINWNLRFSRNNKTYKMLISICQLIIEGLLQDKSEGSKQLMDFIDEQRMSRLYEKFIFEYYKQEFPQLSVTASHIPWSLDNNEAKMLPSMKSDIMLSCNNNYLIIDAKYYTKSLQSFYDTYKIHSANLYQIFTYVKNQDMNLKVKQAKVSGMLLYAKTDEKIVPNNKFQMSGNQISVTTLDMNTDFFQIKKQLNKIVKEYFDI